MRQFKNAYQTSFKRERDERKKDHFGHHLKKKKKRLTTSQKHMSRPSLYTPMQYIYLDYNNIKY